MAWPSKTAVTAAELARLTADIPLIIGRNWARYSGALTKWTTDGNNASADQSAAGYAAFGAGDDYDHLPTQPNAAAVTWFFNFDLGQAIGEVDCFALKNHNGGSAPATVTLQLSTTSNFAVPVDILAVAPANDKRVIALDLREAGDPNPERFSAFRYARLKWVSLGGAITPRFGECWLGRRRQLFATSNFPYAPNRLRSAARVSESESGVQGGISRFINRRRLAFKYIVKDTTAVSDFETLYRDELDGGTLPFLFIEKPNSLSQDALWIYPDMFDIGGEDTGFGERRFTIIGDEQAPNFLAKGVGT